MNRRVVFGMIPVMVGGIIYITFRADSLLMFHWLKVIGIYKEVHELRSLQILQNLDIPSWVKFSLPDALWLLSFNYILLVMWEFKVNSNSVVWILIAPAVGLFSEIGQFLNVVPGIFDIIDLVFLILATVLPFLTTIHKTLKNKIV